MKDDVITRAKKKKALKLIQEGRFDEARQHYVELTRRCARDAESWRMLGAINGQLGLLQAAMEALKRATRIDPDDAEAWFNLGQAYNHSGDFARAAEAYREVVARMPQHADAHNNLGYVLGRLGDEAAATECYRAALQADPKNCDALANMGDALMGTGANGEAIKCLTLAISGRPDFAKAHLSLGHAYTADGDIPLALEHFRRAQALDADNTDAVIGQASAYEKKGDFQRAHELLEPLVQNGESGARLSLALASVYRHFGRLDEAIAGLESALLTPDVSDRNKSQLHFQLGDIYDRLAEYDKAFGHYRDANRLKRLSQRQPGRAEAFIELMDATERIFDEQFMRQAPRSGSTSSCPVFIVGMPRSGTSLVEQILASHPQVYGAGELSLINEMADSLPQRMGDAATKYPECMASVNQDVLSRLAQRYLGKVRELAGAAERVTDKMPHNFQYLGLIELLFPSARIVHCVRDPLDTCLSIFTNDFNHAHSYSSDFSELGRHYLRYRQLMSHWREVLGIPMLEIEYEKLVGRQEEESRKLINFCGLDWDDACLHFHRSDRVVNTPSYDQVRQPIHQKSVGRWQHYDAHLAELKNALKFA